MNKKILIEGKEYEIEKSSYFPSDDSFLLLNSIKDFKDRLVLDVGTGSGIQSISAVLKGAKRVIATDINKKACENLNTVSKENNFPIKAIESNLFENINEKFDLILFNPPYVPSDKIKYIELDGGKKGREIIDKFLMKVKDYLNKDGIVYLLQSSLNDNKETSEKLVELGFNFEIISEKKLFFETLVVYKFWLK